MPQVARLDVHPVKALDPHPVESVRVRESGALDWDRRYAIVDADGDPVNGKADAAVHRFGADFDLAAGTVAVGPRDGARESFHLETDRDALADWLSEYFGYPVDVVREDAGLPDDTDAHGPTVVASGTLDAVADWFDLTREDVRRRFRPNVVVDAPAFWDDDQVPPAGEDTVLAVGDAAFAVDGPCTRCVVPTRDPDTGEAVPPDFRERFVRRRQETLPPTVARDRFDHGYVLCLNTRLVEGAGGSVAVGDVVGVAD
jgi:uncharacterized protein YcbX